MKRLTRFLANEDGIAMATAIGMIVVLTVLAVVLIDQVTTESTRAAKAVTSDAVYQAAEAGINDYIAKLTDDSQYYDHCVAKGESTRQRVDNGVQVSHSIDTSSCDPGGPSAWTAGVKWIYPVHKNWWYPGTGTSYSNSTKLRGYAYNLEITPPYPASGNNPGTTYIDVVSTGCKVIDPNATPVQCDTTVPERAVEVHLRRTTPADFQYMMTNMTSTDPCWASTIYGKMYSTGDIQVCGATFYGNVMAEGLVRVRNGYQNPPNVIAPARIYDQNHPDIRTVLKNQLSFSDLLASVTQVQSNAELNTNLRAGSSSTGVGTDFDDTSASAWRLNFSSNGNMEVWRCVNSSTPEANIPYCDDVHLAAATTLPKSTISINANENTASFPSSNISLYIGTGSSIDHVTCTGKTTTSFTGCSGGSHAHSAGDVVSIYSGGLPGPIPAYNGPIPPNGAVYTGQDAVISWPNMINGYNETSSDGSPTSKVNGKVTVASGQDVVVAGDVHYASEPAQDGTGGPDDDVLGLIAQGNVWMARYAPNKIWWRAATMAIDGSWGDYACKNGPDRGSSSYMTFVGTATYGSNEGCIHGSGGYGYIDSSGLKNVYRITDDGTAPACPSTAPGCQNFNALKFLVPPWFPPLNGMETVLFREVPPTYVPQPAP
jgi:hypothetical protein